MQLFGMNVYPYGMALAFSAAICLLIAGFSEKKNGLKSGTISWFAVLALPFGVLCARMLYCISCWSWFIEKGLPYFFRISDGGLMLFGAMGGCIIAAIIAAKITDQSPLKVMDALASPAALMIALSRMAEGIVSQGYGWPVGDWFSVDAFDAEEYTGMSLFHLEDVSFFEGLPFSIPDMYGDYHWAIFLVEALIAVVIAIILLRTKDTRPGWKAMLFVMMYSAMQCLGESLRQDAVVRLGFVRVNQIIAAVLAILVVGTICAVHLPKGKEKLRQILTMYIGSFLMVGIVILMEFALEKKIIFMEAVPMDVCYMILAAACIGMILFIHPVWKKSNQQV